MAFVTTIRWSDLSHRKPIRTSRYLIFPESGIECRYYYADPSNSGWESSLRDPCPTFSLWADPEDIETKEM